MGHPEDLQRASWVRLFWDRWQWEEVVLDPWDAEYLEFVVGVHAFIITVPRAEFLQLLGSQPFDDVLPA